MTPEDLLPIRIATANAVVKALDEAITARVLCARLLDMTLRLGVASIIAGSIPREFPPEASGPFTRTERQRPLPPPEAEATPPPPFVFERNSTHVFAREAGETAHWTLDGALRRDEWIRGGKGLLFPVVDNETDAYGLGFFGPALSSGSEAAETLGFLAHYAFARLLKIDRMSKAPRLSERQIATLKWAAEGKTDQEIGVILNVSGHTVDKYMRHIKQELNAVNRTSAIVLAMRLGLIV